MSVCKYNHKFQLHKTLFQFFLILHSKCLFFWRSQMCWVGALSIIDKQHSFPPSFWKFYCPTRNMSRSCSPAIIQKVLCAMYYLIKECTKNKNTVIDQNHLDLLTICLLTLTSLHRLFWRSLSLKSHSTILCFIAQ